MALSPRVYHQSASKLRFRFELNCMATIRIGTMGWAIFSEGIFSEKIIKIEEPPFSTMKCLAQDSLLMWVAPRCMFVKHWIRVVQSNLLRFSLAEKQRNDSTFGTNHSSLFYSTINVFEALVYGTGFLMAGAWNGLSRHILFRVLDVCCASPHWFGCVRIASDCFVWHCLGFRFYSFEIVLAKRSMMGCCWCRSAVCITEISGHPMRLPCLLCILFLLRPHLRAFRN